MSTNGPAVETDRFHDPKEIRRRRIRAGRSQQDVAREVGITPPHLSNIELGHANPSPPVLKRIADALKCAVADLEKRPA